MRTEQMLRASIAFIMRWRNPQPGEAEEVRDVMVAVMVADGVDPDEAREVATELAEAGSELAAAVAACHPQAERMQRAMKTLDELAERIAREEDEK